VGRAAHYSLIAVFAILSISVIRQAIYDDWLGRDSKTYLHGAAAWLNGMNPWDASALAPRGQIYHFAGLPPTLLAYAPLIVLPEWSAVAVTLVIGAMSAVYVLRRLGLPAWWLLFPPIAECLISGNPSLPILALLVATEWPARALAPVVKVYALAPLLGERDWRSVGLASCLLALTGILLLPQWLVYIGNFGAISGRLFAQAGGGFSGASDPRLFIAGVLGLACLALIRDWRAVGWLIIPALWPATQFHYSTLALPVIHPILAVGLAFPIQGLPPLVIAAYGLWRLFLWRWGQPTIDTTSSSVVEPR
jgi:hypothetical protein